MNDLEDIGIGLRLLRIVVVSLLLQRWGFYWCLRFRYGSTSDQSQLLCHRAAKLGYP